MDIARKVKEKDTGGSCPLSVAASLSPRAFQLPFKRSPPLCAFPVVAFFPASLIYTSEQLCSLIFNPPLLPFVSPVFLTKACVLFFLCSRHNHNAMRRLTLFCATMVADINYLYQNEKRSGSKKYFTFKLVLRIRHASLLSHFVLKCVIKISRFPRYVFSSLLYVSFF